MGCKSRLRRFLNRTAPTPTHAARDTSTRPCASWLRISSPSSAANVMDFPYDISAHSYRGARRDAYSRLVLNETRSKCRDDVTTKNPKLFRVLFFQSYSSQLTATNQLRSHPNQVWSTGSKSGVP